MRPASRRWQVYLPAELFLCIKLLCNTIFSLPFNSLFFSISLNNNWAASLPTLNAGWVMVVKAGESKEAVRRLEKLTAFSCCGIFNLISLQT